MNAIDSVLGRPGEPVNCRSIAGMSVHWWRSMDAKPGDWCLCGEMRKKAEPEEDG